MSVALLFPGQGSQFSGMGKELYDEFPAAKAVFEEASDALSRDMAALCFQGTEEELRLTENTQPAIFTVSVAAFRALEEKTGIAPLCAAGHSLGEYSALTAAGVLSLEEAIRVLRSRGRYMQEAVPADGGAMAAIIGLEREKVEEACRAASSVGIVSPANYNGGGQIVISGATKAVTAACEAAKAAGAKKAVPLQVSGPFHCELMRSAAERLAPEIGAMSIGAARFPVVANVTASPCLKEEVADLLVRQVFSPVRWEESVRSMRGMGATAFLEIGPGKVLSGLVKRIEKDLPVVSFCGITDMDAVAALPR
ncbi:MAG: ACP S-malonyltransferase [Syntrophorhabdaceae bacterium]|nr:ACP S-malonyltransferase [Syntrophorhabdaceae bacterium]